MKVLSWNVFELSPLIFFYVQQGLLAKFCHSVNWPCLLCFFFVCRSSELVCNCPNKWTGWVYGVGCEWGRRGERDSMKCHILKHNEGYIMRCVKVVLHLFSSVYYVWLLANCCHFVNWPCVLCFVCQSYELVHACIMKCLKIFLHLFSSTDNTWLLSICCFVVHWPCLLCAKVKRLDFIVLV